MQFSAGKFPTRLVLVSNRSKTNQSTELDDIKPAIIKVETPRQNDTLQDMSRAI